MIETARIRREKAKVEAAARRDYRMKLWVGICTSVVTAENCKSPSVGPNWANHALAEFDKAFPEVTP